MERQTASRVGTRDDDSASARNPPLSRDLSQQLIVPLPVTVKIPEPASWPLSFHVTHATEAPH